MHVYGIGLGRGIWGAVRAEGSRAARGGHLQRDERTTLTRRQMRWRPRPSDRGRAARAMIL